MKDGRFKKYGALAIVWFIFLSFGLFAGFASAGSGGWKKETTIKESGETAVEKMSICPKTLMKNSCTNCHAIPDWKIKEALPGRLYNFPEYGMSIVDGKLHYLIKSIDSDDLDEIYRWLKWHQEIRHIVFEIMSPGGSMFEAKRMINTMNMMKKDGYILETHCSAFAASAGFIVFAAGNKGHRFVSPEAELMWHELITFKMFDISGPADKEDEARVLRHLQDTQNQWLVSRGNMTKDEIDAAIRKKELWMNGADAVAKGFADGFLGENN